MWSVAASLLLFQWTNGQNLYGNTSEYSDLFTDDEYQTMTTKRIRSEIRDISDDQWDRVANALDVMKNISENEGKAIYGDYYRNYDALVCQHAITANGPSGDMGHGPPIFAVWHRAFLLSVENSLIAIDPDIDGLPYWDWRRDQLELNETADISDSLMFTDDYFGDYHNDVAITNGRFGHWTVHSNASEVGCGESYYQNAFGLLRGPTNTEGNPHITRYGGSVCDSPWPIGILSLYDACLSHSNITDFVNCFDAPVHGTTHWGVAGTKPTHWNQSVSDGYDCIGWQMAATMLNGIRHWPGRYGCFDCPSVGSCTFDSSDEWANYECAQCDLSNLTDVDGTCNVLGENVIILGDYYDQHFPGDFNDISTSPNDPLFMFHHANLDRYVHEWQLRNYENAPYYGYPTTGYSNLTRLSDPLGPDFPFEYLFEGEMAEQIGNDSFTVKDVWDGTTFLDSPYVYDSVLNLVYRDTEDTPSPTTDDEDDEDTPSPTTDDTASPTTDDDDDEDTLSLTTDDDEDTVSRDNYGLDVGAVELAMIIIFFLLIMAVALFWFFVSKMSESKKKEEEKKTAMTTAARHETATSNSSESMALVIR